MSKTFIEQILARFLTIYTHNVYGHTDTHIIHICMYVHTLMVLCLWSSIYNKCIRLKFDSFQMVHKGSRTYCMLSETEGNWLYQESYYWIVSFSYFILVNIKARDRVGEPPRYFSTQYYLSLTWHNFTPTCPTLPQEHLVMLTIMKPGRGQFGWGSYWYQLGSAVTLLNIL